MSFEGFNTFHNLNNSKDNDCRFNNFDIKWHPCIDPIVRQEIATVLLYFGIFSCYVGYGPEPTVFKSNGELYLCLTPSALEKSISATSQLSSVLYAKGYKRLNKQENVTWDYCAALERYIPVFEEILPPSTTESTKLFLEFILHSQDLFKDKRILEIGSGCGALSVALGRLAKHLVCVDISQKAVDNTNLTFNQENKDVRKKVLVGVSDIYSNLEDISDIESKFDIVLFNNPLISELSESTSDYMKYAGHDFDSVVRAITNLNCVLKHDGGAYFLTSEICEGERSIKDSIRNIFSRNSIKKYYWDIEKLSSLARHVKPLINIENTEFEKLVYSNPDIKFLITKISFC